MQVDHIVSVYWYKGENDIENYNPACRMCNFTNRQGQSKILKRIRKVAFEARKGLYFRLAVKYGLIKKTDNPIEFYFENQNKTGKESENDERNIIQRKIRKRMKVRIFKY